MALAVTEDKNYFGLFELPDVKTKVGSEAVWEEPKLSTKSYKTVYYKKSANIEDRDDWPDQYSWLKDKLEFLYTVFHPLLMR